MVEINSRIVGRANGKFKGSVFPDKVFIHGKVADAYESGMVGLFGSPPYSMK